MVAPRGAGNPIEAEVLTSGGDRVPVRIGSSSALSINSDNVTCITITDLTSERQAEAELAHSAQHDTLTGLANRSLLADRIRTRSNAEPPARA